RNGRTVSPKSQLPRRNSPSASIIAELTMSKPLAAPECAAKYELISAVRSWSLSPTPAVGAVRAPSSDCVQNHTARTTPVTTTRESSVCQWIGRRAGFMGRRLLLCPTLLLCNVTRHLKGQFPRLSQIELSGPQIRQFFDAQKLIGSRPPKRRQVTFPQ